MPGLIGVAGTQDPGRFDAALGKLVALPGARTERHDVTDDLTLGAVSRGRASGGAELARDGAAAVLLYGSMFRESPRPRPVRAAELLPAARDGRLAEELADCEGGYCVAAIDLRSRRLTVLADRVGSQPVYWARHGNALAFGPEVKSVLTALGKDAAWSPDGLFGFLSVGYGLGARTLFDGVACLEPGTRLEHDPRTGATSVRRHWALRFAQGDALEERGEAEEALFDAIVRGHRLLLSDGAEHQILLSGGVDSRGMLGVLRHLGRPPAQAVAWGARDDIAWSDADIARRLARATGTPFRFLPYTAEAFVENAAEWAFVSELANDNVGWYGEGLGALGQLAAEGARASFVGDEVWGAGGAISTDEQIFSFMRVPRGVPGVLRRVLRPAAAERAGASHDAALEEVMRPCDSKRPSDRREFFYLHGRAARFIMSLGYYKEHATELRRPFLTRPVLDVVARLPERFRTYKNLYCTMMTRRFPALMTYPDNLVSSLPDWSFATRRDPRLSGLLRELLDWSELERGPLAALLERRAFEALRDGFFAERPSPLDRRFSPFDLASRVAVFRSALAMRASCALKDRLRPPEVRDGVGTFDVLRRMALVALLQRRLPELSRR